MGTHSSTERSRLRGRRGVVLGLGLGLVVAAAAWAALVYAAITFGGRARDGDSSGWTLMALAGLGAVVCLFAALLLGVRLVAVRRGDVPPRAGGGHRR